MSMHIRCYYMIRLMRVHSSFCRIAVPFPYYNICWRRRCAWTLPQHAMQCNTAEEHKHCPTSNVCTCSMRRTAHITMSVRMLLLLADKQILVPHCNFISIDECTYVRTRNNCSIESFGRERAYTKKQMEREPEIECTVHASMLRHNNNK